MKQFITMNYRSLAGILLFTLLSSVESFSQQATIVDNATKYTYEGKSYIVINSLTLSGSSGFVFTATPGQSFYIKMSNSNSNSFIPSLDQNFVRKETTLISGVTAELSLNSLPVEQKSTTYNYFDGLGRPDQDVIIQASPSKTDVVLPYSYDANGRKNKDYLAYPKSGSTKGAFANSGLSEQGSFFASPGNAVPADNRPYVEHVLESSPLDRTTETFGVGDKWKIDDPNNLVRKPVKKFQKIAQASDNVVKWKYITTSTTSTPERDTTVPNGVYPANLLMVEESTDEDGQVTKIFKDLRGLTILSRVGNGSIWFDTYYIYNPDGQLRVVIQPEGVTRLATEYEASGADKQSFLNRWSFRYNYDTKQRLTEKRIPGWTGWEYTVYDIWNRIVFSQTPAQGENDEWTFYKYDAFNRVIMTGLYTSSSNRNTLQSAVDSYYITNPNNRYEATTASAEGFTLNSTYPNSVSSNDLIKITYYDNYDFLNYTNWDAESPISTYNFVQLSGFPQSSDLMTSVKGYETGSKVKILGQNQWLNSVTRYDKRYHPVQIFTETHLGGKLRTTTLYDFVGRPLKTQYYYGVAPTLTVLREFEYDHAGRLLKTFQTTDSDPRILLSSNKYNEIGQLIEKNIHSTDNGANFLQSIDMRYNIRGWLTSINNSQLSNDGVMNNDTNDLFGMELLYNPTSSPAVSNYPTAGNIVPKHYNGNIGAIKWKSLSPDSPDKTQIYAYDYDALYRLNKAYYSADDNGTWTAEVGMFDEEITAYDKNGNIKGIKRDGKVEGVKTRIDETTYGFAYSGSISNFSGESNRLLNIEDSNGNDLGFKDAAAQIAEEYIYDASGNLIYDHNKSISSISYNYLNLPEVIEFTRPSTIDRIKYVYDANGNKLQMIVEIDGTQVWKSDYIADVQYDNDVLKFASTPEGRLIKTNSGYEYEYFYKDHQGNVRLAFTSRNETDSYRATMEDVLGADEESEFNNIASTRPVVPVSNYTKPSEKVLNPQKSAETNSYTGKTIGPAKSLHLQAGDKVKMEVYARYNQVTGSSNIVASTALVSALATSTFGFSVGETAYAGFNNYAPNLVGTGNPSTTVPKAYLAFIFFNESYGVVTYGAVSITTSAYQSFEKLEQIFKADENGYLYTYVANESSVAGVNVYFDEMLIVHEKTNKVLQVTQASDYYPFGLAFNTYNMERGDFKFPIPGPFGDPDDVSYTQMTPNRYGFQGQEFQNDLDLGWSQFKWRMHDPAIGRFASVDPLSDKYHYNSTYAFSENKVTSHVELEGLEAFGIHGTWSTPDTWEDPDGISFAAALAFHNNESNFNFEWSGNNTSLARTVAARKLVEFISKNRSKDTNEPITLIGHSHGGNVAIEAINLMMTMDEFKGLDINLITINTPVREDYQLRDESIDHLNVYDPWDPVQVRGGNDPENRSLLKSDDWNPQIPTGERRGAAMTGEFGKASRVFRGAKNIKVKNPEGIFGDFHNSHNRVKDWIDMVPDFTINWNEK